MDGTSASWIGGIYENTAFFENGEWKFGRQDLHHIFNASYKNGWAQVCTPSRASIRLRGASKRQRTNGTWCAKRDWSLRWRRDGPIRARQYVFPEIDEPAFHYKNPRQRPDAGAVIALMEPNFWRGVD